jgi:methyltransferase
MTSPVPLSLHVVPIIAAVAVMMLAEAAISRRHERILRASGAVEPGGDVYATMQWAYPAAFLAMAVEGAVLGPFPPTVIVGGVVLMIAAKLLKWWAMAALGVRWTFRVLVLPGAPLVTGGPYAIARHPNYVAVVGELVAMAMMTGARVIGPVGTLFFSWLILRRMRVENSALGHPTCS